MKKLFVVSLALFWTLTIILCVSALYVYRQDSAFNAMLQNQQSQQINQTAQGTSSQNISSIGFNSATESTSTISTSTSVIHSESTTIDATTTAVVCTSFTYSSWGTCKVDGTQVRSINTSLPLGCSLGAPKTTQVCTYIAPTPVPRTITSATVAMHNTADSCWMIILGKAYDVTAYIPFHPGGVSRIVTNCGKDATVLFTSNANGGHRHSTSAHTLLANYYISDL